MSVEDTVLGMWKALSARDWDSVKSFLSDDCIYCDMPLGPALSTRGPEDIIAKLKIGLAPLASYENHDGVLVSNGDDALYEHSETWNWDTGETALLRFVTVHKVRDGKIAVWKDYWDMSGLTNTAPATWLEGVTAAYAVPMFDATGLI